MGTTNTLDLNNRISALEKGEGGASRADITYVKMAINSLTVASTWGQLYTGNVNVDISSLNLNNTPDIVSAVYQQTSGGAAMTMVSNVSTTAVSIDLIRGLSGESLTGNLIIGVKSNG